MNNIKLLIVFLGCVLFAVAVQQFSSVLVLFAVAGLIAFLLNPIAKLIQRRFKMKKIFSVILVFIILIIFIAIILSTLMPEIVSQIKSLIQNLPTYSATFEGMYQDFMLYLKEFNIPSVYLESVSRFIANLDTYVTSFVVKLATTILGLSTKILDVVVVIILTVYFMLDTRYMIECIALLFPKKYAEKFINTVEESNQVVWTYLKSKTIISAGMGLTTFIILTVLKADYALLLALFAFVMDYIPYFGSIFAGLVAGMVTLVTGGLSQALIVLTSVLVIQQIEGNIVVPKVQGDTMGLHPIVVLFAILACNKLWGPFGMFLAIPLAAILKIVLREFYYYLKSE